MQLRLSMLMRLSERKLTGKPERAGDFSWDDKSEGGASLKFNRWLERGPHADFHHLRWAEGPITTSAKMTILWREEIPRFHERSAELQIPRRLEPGIF